MPTVVDVLISRNLHIKDGFGWAVRDASTRRVVAYAGQQPKKVKPGVLRLPYVEVVDATCLVDEKARLAVVAAKSRSVHAYCRGRLPLPLEALAAASREPCAGDMPTFSYNPFRAATFVCGPRPVWAADRMLFTAAGSWVEGAR
jgi:hypothetical protein